MYEFALLEFQSVGHFFGIHERLHFEHVSGWCFVAVYSVVSNVISEYDKNKIDQRS